MAYVTTDDAGMAELRAQLSKMGRPMIRQIVEAGAGAAEKLLQKRVVEAGHRRNGDLTESIRGGDYREFLDGGAEDVYPQGYNRRGERLQTIAYVINYGIPGHGRRNRDGSRYRMRDHFWTKADEAAEKAAGEAMQAESDRLMGENGGE